MYDDNKNSKNTLQLELLNENATISGVDNDIIIADPQGIVRIKDALKYNTSYQNLTINISSENKPFITKTYELRDIVEIIRRYTSDNPNALLPLSLFSLKMLSSTASTESQEQKANSFYQMV